MPSRNTKPRSPHDKRLKANLPPERRAKPVPLSRYQRLLNGELTVEDLDDQEVIAGRCKDRNGGFTGRPPDKFPRALHDALRAEFQKRMAQKFQEGTDIGYATLIEVAQSKHAAAQARVTAAIQLIERGVGKVPDQVGVTMEIKPFEQDIEGLLVDVVDAEVIDFQPKEIA